MTPIAQQALDRARAKLTGGPELQGDHSPITQLAGVPVQVVPGIPAGSAFLIATPAPKPQQVVQVKQLTKHTVQGPTDHFLFLQGRAHALELAASLHVMEARAICDNLRRSIVAKPESYARGIQSVIELIEAQP